jgi:hypothetical protein
MVENNCSYNIFIILSFNQYTSSFGISGAYSYVKNRLDFLVESDDIMRNCKLIGCLFVISFLLSLSAKAHAQCAYGVDVGGGNCIPPDAAGMPEFKGYNNPAPRQNNSRQNIPSTDLSSIYISIYIVPDGRLAWTTGPAWVNHGYPPELGVINSGWSFCKNNQKGGGTEHRNCVLLNFTHDSCVSYSYDIQNGKIFHATDRDSQRAMNTALTACSKDSGGNGCKLVTDEPICSTYDQGHDQNNHGYIEKISPQAIDILREKYNKNYNGWIDFAKKNYHQDPAW